MVDFFVVMKKWCLFDFKCSYLTSTFTYNFWSFITEGIVMDYMFLVEELLFFSFYFGCCLLYSEKKDMNVKDFGGSSTDSDD